MEKDYIIEGYCDMVGDLLSNEMVQSMKTYNHHGKISTHFHSVYVSFNVYKSCLRLKLDNDKTKEITRAALVHDFYLYDWHITKHEEKHAWYHPKAAEKNVEKYLFEPTKMQKEMILYHMFPLSSPPRSVGGWLLTLNDKHCANIELAGLSKGFVQTYNKILERGEKHAS